ncbi:hypothetical protein HOL63_00835 [Candidatus Peregrinibacteria bacterium]|jgi:hypothetical protein|nr:hypothetical protein [Candidatus Peregrinibacteria bacterium]MBT5468781.1 hypothetical protein [Candidatus Peregrinibacteria bacterium]MBT7337103.1 hypothetical protein [Candidatus Peregrinibacteria bacterium]
MNTNRFTAGFIALIVMAISIPLVAATTTAPQRIIYNGHLLDSSGDAVTTEHTIRFSYWSSTDSVSGDVTATGAINIGAANYASWTEVHTVTPNSGGYFSVELGSVTGLPDFSTMSVTTLLNLHLQVEVKAAAGANTAFELLDRNGADDTIDRSPVRSVPFSLNANLLDRHEVGTASGSISFLGSGGFLREAGTLTDRFTLDADNSTGGSIALRFGTDLGKELSYEQDSNYFNFNDDVNIEGDLTITGLINGVDITTIAAGSDQTHLKVSSGTTLAVNISAGDYRINGAVTQYSGNSNQTVVDEATNYVFMGSGGLTIQTSGFPTDESFIRLATVVATGGAITTITDRRVFNSDDRESTIVRTYAPDYEGAAYEADGTQNTGQLHVSSSGAAVGNHYVWTSTRDSLQDYDIVVHSEIPSDFVRWDANPLSIRYRTTSGSIAYAKSDIEVYDTAGVQVTLTGDSSDLTNTEWTVADIGFSGAPTWTTGSGFLIKIRPFAKDSQEVQLGHLKIRYTELKAE